MVLVQTCYMTRTGNLRFFVKKNGGCQCRQHQSQGALEVLEFRTFVKLTNDCLNSVVCLLDFDQLKVAILSSN